MRIAIFLSVLLSVGTFATAAEFKGASEVLRQAAQASPKSSAEKPKDPYQSFREKLKVFEAQNTNLPPSQAASQWLILVDDFQKTSGEHPAPAGRGFPAAKMLQFDEVVNVLPPPAAWPDLERAIENRPSAEASADQKRELGLRLIAHTLTKNISRRTEDLKALALLAKKSGDRASGFEFTSIFQTLNNAILATMDDPEAILRMLESQLPESEEFHMPLHIPNLVTLVGPAKTETFLRNALRTSRQLQMEPGTPTHKLAVRLAVEMVDQMPSAHWELVNSLDSVELFEAMQKKFSKSGKQAAKPVAETGFFEVNEPGPSRMDDRQAKLYYFLGLIARNRADDAIRVAKEFDQKDQAYFPPELIKQMERAGLTLQLNNFFAALLKDSPESPFWGEYVRVAAHAGHAHEALALVRTTSERKDLSHARRSEFKYLLPAALLANDEVEAGIAELRRSLTNQEPSWSGSGYYYSYSSGGFGEPAIAIAKIGKLMDRKEWIEEGIAAAKKTLAEESNSEPGDWSSPEIELAEFLSESGRGPEAEEVLMQALQRAIAKRPGAGRGFNRYGPDSSATTILAALLRVYHQAARFDDVLSLLDQADYWGVKDLADLQENGRFGFTSFSYSGRHSLQTPPAFYAAFALAKKGRKQEADVILNHLLDKEPGLDRLYELLLDLEPTNPVPRLDALFSQDQFEERPLIWKAHWLRMQGKLEEAEQAARKAISIDPSDGEQGPGDRMRAYAELAEVRSARGDAKEAAFFREAVAAIRESELADRFHEAGLLKRAVKMYQDSLTHFSDAYCIQSRLAIQLADLGQHEAAEEHYRKAYELMPDSFGRVESHCFGCERAFEGERAQGIAERVFTQIAEKTPNKPQVHYLLGYLREEQDRPKDALDQYRVAVKLDADYLNAWHKIWEVSTKAVVPSAERDSVVFNLFRLDPRHRHASYGFDTVSDLATLWRRIAEASLVATVPPKALYPLAASQKKLSEKSAAEPTEEENGMFERFAEMRQDEASPAPAKAVGQNGFVRAGVELISASVMRLD